MNLAPFNIDMKKPVSKLVEYLEILRKLWSGERFTHEGRFWQFNDAYLQIRPHQESIPVYFGSNSPRMLRLTGKFADGWMPLGLTPKMYRNRLAQLKESARKSGRNIEDIDVGLYIGACISENPDELAVLEGWKSLLVPDALIEAGYEIPEKFRSFHYKDWELTPENMAEIADYASHVPSEAAKDFFLMGNADECVERVDEYIKAGVKHFIFSFAAFDHGKMMEEFMNQVLTPFKT
jgi:alkanesulfonate monooxygenase SsuD/methylene tetrahydromethanopterin reductase-like flavin-dependent oxidoreductase (luciferase family)